MPTTLIRLPGPLDIPASLEMFRRAGDDGIDRWDGEQLVRTLQVSGRTVAYACAVAGTLIEPALTLRVEDERHLPHIERAVRAMFFAAPPAFAALLTADPVLARLDAQYPGLRTVRQYDLCAALVRCISAQQVNLRWAATTRRRLAETFGEQHVVDGHTVYSLNPARLASASVEAIRALQFTVRKAEYVIGAARAVTDGTLDIATLDTLPDDDVIARLTDLRGIGRWSAEWILARTLGRPRVVAGDLAVRKAVGAAYLGHSLPPEDEVRRATAHWGASAGVAQTLVLQGYSGGALAT
ncbi:MAG: hypothetical protein OJF49_004374 [Ktedonobacterales bacterium]|jgi:DNA-3-methyladenine glycosylase II|nr:MAG: hypothetical protein OJF49_004374 [Ktedonobacterales bacterium]